MSKISQENTSKQGPVETQIRDRLGIALQPTHLEVENESHSHSVPRGSETHFRVLVVSEKFIGINRVQRQRLVNEAVKDLFDSGLHALAQRAYTSDEWTELGSEIEITSPPCMGGSKKL